MAVANLSPLENVAFCLVSQAKGTLKSSPGLRQTRRWRAWLLPLLIAGFLSQAMPRMTSAAGTGEISVPLRWCVVLGSPTAMNPGRVDPDNPGADLNTVLWRRHERVTDRIYSPHARITFRSAVTSVMLSTSLLTIPDPDTSSGQPGDISLETVAGRVKEVEDAVLSCDANWKQILGASSALPGFPVISARQLLDAGGALGRGTVRWNCGNSTTNPATFVPTWVVLADRSFFSSGDLDANLVGHELGHVLGLQHTNVSNNLMQAFVVGRNFGTVNESEPASFNCLVGPAPRSSINQVSWLRQAADLVSGKQIDPPALLIPGPVQEFVAVDIHEDVPEGESFVDLSAVIVGTNQFGNFSINFRVLGSPKRQGAGTLDYWAVVDADNDSTTGGGTSDYPKEMPPSSFAGADFLVQVRVSPEKPEPEATLWNFEPGQQQFRPDGHPVASFQHTVVSHTGQTSFEFVKTEFLDFSPQLPPLAERFRIHALSHNLDTGTVDTLDGDEGAESGVLVSLLPPTFPVCRADEKANGLVKVFVSGLNPDAGIHVVLGDEEVAKGQTDSSGEAEVEFWIPPQDARRLVTVGNDGTALTADCTLAGR